MAVIRAGRIITNLPTHQLLDRYVEDRFEVITTAATALTDRLPAEATVTSADGKATILLPSAHQDRLYEVLAGLHAEGLPVLGVSRVHPSLEEVFLQLVHGE